MPDPTPNLGLERPDFNVATWHDQVNGNFTILDAAVAGLVNITGVWENDVAYVIGDFVVDSTDATIWECLVNHTSIASGPMSVDRLANPTYWQQVADIATLAAQAQASADAALASAAAAAASAAAAAAIIATGIGWINVKDYGAIGDGVTDDTAAIYAAKAAAFVETENNDSTDTVDNIRLRFPAGHYIVTEPIEINGAFGVIMAGDGEYSTTIESTATDGSSVFYSDGMRNSIVKDMRLIAPEASSGGPSCCWDLDWNGGPFSAPTNVTFENVIFSGVIDETVGCRIANTSGNNNSEHRFINCSFNDHLYGLHARSFNVLNIAIEDGGATNCQRAYYIEKGSIGRINNVSLAGNDIDIYTQNGTMLTVSESRTESPIFISFTRGVLNVIGCKQETGDTATYFVKSGGGAQDKMVTLVNCISDSGQIQLPLGSGGGDGTPPNLVMNCQFGRDDYYVAGSVFRYIGLEVGKWDGGASGSGTYTVLQEGTRGVGGNIYSDGDYYLDIDGDIIVTDNGSTVDFSDATLRVSGGELDIVEPGGPSAVTVTVAAITANRILTIDMGDADRTLTFPISSTAVTIREVTAAGAVTANATTDDVIVVNKTVGAATTVNLPAVASRDTGRPYKIVDGKLDASTNNITIDPNGAETVLGLSTWVISTDGGSVTIWPLPSGGKWYIA